MKRVAFKKALKIVTETIKEYDDLYYGYQSNIAMACYDAIRKKGVYIPHEVLHEACNNAAKNFLNSWTGKK